MRNFVGSNAGYNNCDFCNNVVSPSSVNRRRKDKCDIDECTVLLFIIILLMIFWF